MAEVSVRPHSIVDTSKDLPQRPGSSPTSPEPSVRGVSPDRRSNASLVPGPSTLAPSFASQLSLQDTLSPLLEPQAASGYDGRPASAPYPAAAPIPMPHLGPHLVPPTTASGVDRTFFATMTLNLSDRIRLIGFNSEEHAVIEHVVNSVWPKGVQQSGKYASAWEIKCRGYPWMRESEGDDNARRLILRMVQALHDMGWILNVALDISKKGLDKDSLVFRRTDRLDPNNPGWRYVPPRCDWIAVSFDWHDKLKIVGDTPPDMAVSLVRQYANLVEAHELYGDRLKIHFRNKPWLPDGLDTVRSREMVHTLLERLDLFGFSVYGSMDISSGAQGNDTDVLICRRPKGWVPNAHGQCPPSFATALACFPPRFLPAPSSGRPIVQ